MRALLLCIASVVCAGLAHAAAADEFPMRWRTFCDYRWGVSFRYPYQYFIPDQYGAGLVRDRSIGSTQAMVPKEIEIEGKKVLVLEKLEPKASGLDVRCLSSAAGELPSEVQGKSLAEIGDYYAGQSKMADDSPKLDWKPYDYYSVTGRPHGDPAWATPNIEGLIGEGGGICGLVLKHGDRYSALFVHGGLTDVDNRPILDSFEAMTTKGKETMTWRESQYRQGKPIGVDGKPTKAVDGKAKSLGWPKAWEIETKHYHVTTDVSPKKLLDYGVYLEALYKAYSEVYDPDQIPPYKMEIHVFTTWQDFAGGAGANGIPVSSQTGGFFVPSLLSIFAFQETEAHFNSSTFTLEEVLAHECSHQFLHCTCNGSDHVPTWLNEGLAVYFESGKFLGGRFQVMPPSERVNRLKAEYARTKATLWPLGDYLEHYGHIDALQYGEVYAMTHFWIFGSESGKKHFKAYWQALKAGENGTDAFERIFMADLIKIYGNRAAAVQAWQAKLIEYVQKKLK